MISSFTFPETSPRRYPEVLVAPAVTLAAVLVLLLVARVYEALPVKPPVCAFKNTTGIPCPGCGGTRSMQALSRGKIQNAVQFNPGVVLGVSLSGLWFLTAWIRYNRGSAPLSRSEQGKTVKRNLLLLAIVMVANWIYLINYLP